VRQLLLLAGGGIEQSEVGDAVPPPQRHDRRCAGAEAPGERGARGSPGDLLDAGRQDNLVIGRRLERRGRDEGERRPRPLVAAGGSRRSRRSTVAAFIGPAKLRRRAAPWAEHRYVRVVQGHQQVRTVAAAGAGDLTSWDGFVAAAARHGAPGATLWACLIREVAPTAPPAAEAHALVSTRPWADGAAALHAYRPRWHIEDDTYRELKAGRGLEAQRWGHDAAVARGRVTLTCLAFNTAQVYRSRAGARLATHAIRRLRRQHQPRLGAAPAVIYLGERYAVLALEELLAALGVPVRESLLPDLPP
jgi:hypothetical protein